MKSFVVVFTILIAGIHAEEIEFVTFPPEQNDRLKINAFKCVAETGVSFEALGEVRKGNLPDDEGFKKFNFCFFEKVGIITSDGKLNIDKALEELPSGVNKTDTKAILEKCKSITGADLVDTVYQKFKCFFYGSNIRLMLNLGV